MLHHLKIWVDWSLKKDCKIQILWCTSWLASSSKEQKESAGPVTVQLRSPPMIYPLPFIAQSTINFNQSRHWIPNIALTYLTKRKFKVVNIEKAAQLLMSDNKDERVFLDTPSPLPASGLATEFACWTSHWITFNWTEQKNIICTSLQKAGRNLNWNVSVLARILPLLLSIHPNNRIPQPCNFPVPRHPMY